MSSRPNVRLNRELMDMVSRGTLGVIGFMQTFFAFYPEFIELRAERIYGPL